MEKWRCGILVLMMFCPFGVKAAPWEEVIPAVENRAAILLLEAEQRGYADIAARLGEERWRQFHRDDHHCAILGRMLGLPDLVADEEQLDIPEIRHNDVEIADLDVIELYAGSRTLESWVDQANMIVAMDLTARVGFWNQTCATYDRIRYAPKFKISAGPAPEDYPATIYLNDDHVPITLDENDWDDWGRERWLPRIQANLNAGANFAGHYSVSVLGCGTSCRFHSILDARNGASVSPPFGGERSPELNVSFQLDSRLMYARQMGATSGECVLQAWLLDNAELELLYEETSVRPEYGCNDGAFRVISK